MAKYFDLRPAGRRLPIVYAHDIESPLARRWRVSQIFAGHGGDFPPLMPVDGGFGRLHIVGAASLNFNETKYIVVPADQINLSPALRRAKILRHHRVPQLPQMKVGVFFAALPGLLVRGPLVGRQRVLYEPVEGSNRGLGYDSGKH